MKENCVIIGKQLINEQMAQSLTRIEGYTGTLVIHTTALLSIVIILASLGLGYVLWKMRKKK